MLKSWAPTLGERHFSPRTEHAAKIAESWMRKAVRYGLVRIRTPIYSMQVT